MILLVDDDPIQNMLTSKLIETASPESKYTVFQNGEEAINAINDGVKPKKILLDINMPIMDGWEFLEEYRSHSNKAQIFILTSSNAEEDLKKAKDFDFITAYFTKPIGLAEIKQILEQ